MKHLLFLVSLTLGCAVSAHELDSAISADQIQKAEQLPQTVIIRTSKSDPTKVEVVHVKEKLAAGKKVDGMKFEKLAMNAEQTGIAYDSSNEKDVVSSTSSWGFGFGFYRPYAGYSYGYGYGYGYNNYYPYYNYASYYGGCGSYYNGCYPRYAYAGYNYYYQPYYGYSTPYYNYVYCNWNPVYY